MTQQQTHKALYIVSFFAFLSMLSIILTLPHIWGLFLLMPGMLIGSVIGNICIFLLIIAPFRKNNLYLFSIIIVAILTSFVSSMYEIYRDLFDPSFSLMTVGIVPGLFTWSVYVLMDFTGLLFLLLRCYGYIKEHLAGLNTKF